MEIRIKIKPQKYTARTKDELLQKITNGKCFTFSSDGCYYTSYNSDDKYVYTLQKHRPKIAQRKDNRGKTIGSSVIKEGFWVGYVYKIPKNLPIKVYQKLRNFTII